MEAAVLWNTWKRSSGEQHFCSNGVPVAWDSAVYEYERSDWRGRCSELSAHDMSMTWDRALGLRLSSHSSGQWHARSAHVNAGARCRSFIMCYPHVHFSFRRVWVYTLWRAACGGPCDAFTSRARHLVTIIDLRELSTLPLEWSAY